MPREKKPLNFMGTQLTMTKIVPCVAIGNQHVVNLLNVKCKSNVSSRNKGCFFFCRWKGLWQPCEYTTAMLRQSGLGACPQLIVFKMPSHCGAGFLSKTVFPLLSGWSGAATLEAPNTGSAYFRLKNWFGVYTSAAALTFWQVCLWSYQPPC